MSRRTCTDKIKNFKHENEVTRRAPENNEILNEIKDDLYIKMDTNHHMRFISERIDKTISSEVAEEAANKLRTYLITKGVNIRNADLAYHRLKSVIKTYGIVSLRPGFGFLCTGHPRGGRGLRCSAELRPGCVRCEPRRHPGVCGVPWLHP